MQRTQAHFFPGARPAPPLDAWLQVPEDCCSGLYKCRVIYAKNVLHAEFHHYIPRPVRRLKLVVDDAIDYAWKFEDRSALNHLFAQKGDCDDVLIVKNGLLSDSSYSNLAFYDGSSWHTPETPLLRGVQRERLLRDGLLHTASIRVEDLKAFSKIALINAMLELGDCVVDMEVGIEY